MGQKSDSKTLYTYIFSISNPLVNEFSIVDPKII